MKELVNQKTVTQSATLDLGLETQADKQNSFIDESPALASLEAKLLRRRKHAQPQTYRRPAYLQYIDYV